VVVTAHHIASYVALVGSTAPDGRERRSDATTTVQAVSAARPLPARGSPLRRERRLVTYERDVAQMTTNASSAPQRAARVTPAHDMRAIVQRRYGAPQRVLRLEGVESPVVGEDDVLVRVRATSVNTPDLIVVTGVPYVLRLKTGLRRPTTAIRGSDVAGVVAAVGGNVSDLRAGDEVFGSVWDNRPVQRSGTFAEFTVVPRSQLARKPAGLGFEEAASSVMVGITALLAIRDVAGVAPGMRVLVNGASGGVGTMAVQIARSLGAEVTGVCSARNVELVRSLGADHVIDYTRADYADTDQRYDVILDNVMSHAPSVTSRLLTPTGIFLPNSVGTTGGIFGGLPRAARAALLGRRGSLRVGLVTCVPSSSNLAALADLLVSKAVKVMIDRTYPLSEAGQAVAHVLTHHARGKVAINV
jgi:NADPH:quinone reductase-like Zn-dependent oxidoreductase